MTEWYLGLAGNINSCGLEVQLFFCFFFSFRRQYALVCYSTNITNINAGFKNEGHWKVRCNPSPYLLRAWCQATAALLMWARLSVWPSPDLAPWCTVTFVGKQYKNKHNLAVTMHRAILERTW